MKKLIILFTTMFISVFANAQTYVVTVNGNGTYEQYIDTVQYPIDSCMIVNSVGVVCDTSVVFDTIYNFTHEFIIGINTSMCIRQTNVLDTSYLAYDTIYVSMLKAIPYDGWEFVNWVVVYTDGGMLCIDTVFSDTICVDCFDSVNLFELNFKRIDESNNVNSLNNSNITIYPNPTTNIFNVDGDFDYLMIYNIRGRLIYRGTLSCFDLQRCSSGVYPVVIFKNGQRFVIEVIKQ